MPGDEKVVVIFMCSSDDECARLTLNSTIDRVYIVRVGKNPMSIFTALRVLDDAAGIATEVATDCQYSFLRAT